MNTLGQTPIKPYAAFLFIGAIIVGIAEWKGWFDGHFHVWVRTAEEGAALPPFLPLLLRFVAPASSAFLTSPESVNAFFIE